MYILTYICIHVYMCIPHRDAISADASCVTDHTHKHKYKHKTHTHTHTHTHTQALDQRTQASWLSVGADFMIAVTYSRDVYSWYQENKKNLASRL